MVVGRTGVNGSLVLKPVVMVGSDDCVRVQTHDRLEEELAAQALQFSFNSAIRAHVLLMVSGQAGHHGEPVVSHAAVDPNSAVALAPIPLPRAVENRVPGMKQSHKSAIHRDANHLAENLTTFLMPRTLVRALNITKS